MRLKAPFEIGSRLLPSLKIGDGRVSLEPTYCTDRYGKQVWRWFVDIPAGEFSRDDLNGHGNTQEMFASLLGFLSACAEAYRHSLGTGRASVNLDLFPPEVAEWAYTNQDELEMLQVELETPGLIQEDE